jgi:phosphomevalonate kinase
VVPLRRAALRGTQAGLGLELERHGPLGDRKLAQTVYARALDAHHRAQGGGSGVDVAASTFGGTLAFYRDERATRVEAVDLPKTLHVAVWTSGVSSSTPELLSRVRALQQSDPARHAELMSTQGSAARAALDALRRRDPAAFLQAIAEQTDCLWHLGEASGSTIVTASCRELQDRAAREHAAVIPSGAGGGDLLLFFGTKPPTAELLARAEQLGHDRLDVALGARGVHWVRP